LAAAEAALGHPVGSSPESRRHVYLGVSHYRTTSSNLVLDIGGGSTELIIGEATSQYLESLDRLSAWP
jgi:exopolyphosphatase/pppGpp-phosphohydrolase